MSHYRRRDEPPTLQLPVAGRTEPKPYSIDALIAHLSNGHEMTVPEIAIRTGIAERSLYRWTVSGLTDRQADHLATALDEHPASIWPEWWAHAPAEVAS